MGIFYSVKGHISSCDHFPMILLHVDTSMTTLHESHWMPLKKHLDLRSHICIYTTLFKLFSWLFERYMTQKQLCRRLQSPIIPRSTLKMSFLDLTMNFPSWYPWLYFCICDLSQVSHVVTLLYSQILCSLNHKFLFYLQLLLL